MTLRTRLAVFGILCIVHSKTKTAIPESVMNSLFYFLVPAAYVFDEVPQPTPLVPQMLIAHLQSKRERGWKACLFSLSKKWLFGPKKQKGIFSVSWFTFFRPFLRLVGLSRFLLLRAKWFSVCLIENIAPFRSRQEKARSKREVGNHSCFCGKLWPFCRSCRLLLPLLLTGRRFFYSPLNGLLEASILWFRPLLGFAFAVLLRGFYLRRITLSRKSTHTTHEQRERKKRLSAKGKRINVYDIAVSDGAVFSALSIDDCWKFLG